MKTIADYLNIAIANCLNFNQSTECYEYCDQISRQCCIMTKLSINILKGGEYH